MSVGWRWQGWAGDGGGEAGGGNGAGEAGAGDGVAGAGDGEDFLSTRWRGGDGGGRAGADGGEDFSSEPRAHRGGASGAGRPGVEAARARGANVVSEAASRRRMLFSVTIVLWSRLAANTRLPPHDLLCCFLPVSSTTSVKMPSRSKTPVAVCAFEFDCFLTQGNASRSSLPSSEADAGFVEPSSFQSSICLSAQSWSSAIGISAVSWLLGCSGFFGASLLGSVSASSFGSFLLWCSTGGWVVCTRWSVLDGLY